MNYLVAPDLKLVFGWNAKCGCTTIKESLLLRLGWEIKGNVHNDMLTKSNLMNGKYGLFDINFVPYLEDTDDYKYVAVLREPHKRLISGLRQRGPVLVKQGFADLTIEQILKRFHKFEFKPDVHHFEPQTKGLVDKPFNRVVDLTELDNLLEELSLPVFATPAGGHMTKYNDVEDCYHSLTLSDILKKGVFSKMPSCWFSKEAIQLIKDLYEEDFNFGANHGLWQ